MDRRRFLGTVVGVTALSGCISGDTGDERRDADGDGVPDSDDYAPTDPSVQRKSDLVTSARPTPPKTTSRPSTVLTIDPPSRSGTTTSTASRTIADNPSNTTTDSIQVDDDYWTDQSRITSYGATAVDLEIHPDRPSVDYERMKIALLVAEYPRKRTYATAYSEPFERDTRSSLTVPIDLDDVPVGTRVNVIASIIPAAETFRSADSSAIETIMETDPFEKRSDGSIVRDPHPTQPDDERGTGYERNAVEGAYSLTVTGRTGGQGWTVNFFAFKSAYLAAAERSRGRSRPEYVAFELTEGTAPLLATILNEEAEANGFTGKREKVEFIIDFVQRLPYVPDDVSSGFDDYTKFILETMVELGGDCEDTAIMLAAILQSEPFNYDMVLIQPPGHMAAGIWSSEPYGYYYTYDGRKYMYIETTGEGWGIGDCPEEYQGQQAYIYQV